MASEALAGTQQSHWDQASRFRCCPKSNCRKVVLDKSAPAFFLFPTRLASALCEAIDAGTSGQPFMSSDRLQHMGDCRDGGRVGKDRIASQEGVLSLVAWLMRRPSQGGREVVGNEPAPLTTSRGAPHTQQTTEHHTGHDHRDASNNPVHE
jgi:hypothetical protein